MKRKKEEFIKRIRQMNIRVERGGLIRYGTMISINRGRDGSLITQSRLQSVVFHFPKLNMVEKGNLHVDDRKKINEESRAITGFPVVTWFRSSFPRFSTL